MTTENNEWTPRNRYNEGGQNEDGYREKRPYQSYNRSNYGNSSGNYRQSGNYDRQGGNYNRPKPNYDRPNTGNYNRQGNNYNDYSRGNSYNRRDNDYNSGPQRSSYDNNYSSKLCWDLIKRELKQPGG